MFIYKFAPVFIYPVGMCCALLVLAWLAAKFGWGLWAKRLQFAGLCLLWLFATPWFANVVTQPLESKYVGAQSLSPPELNYAVVLGGAISPAFAPRQSADLNHAADRLRHAAKLYLNGSVSKVIVSGGHVFPSEYPSEARLMKSALIDWGVWPEHILLEEASRTTQENAHYVAKQYADELTGQAFYLVTSASHMTRSLFWFDAYGLDARPSATDFSAVESSKPWLFNYLPSAAALAQTTRAWHEWLGLLSAYTKRSLNAG